MQHAYATRTDLETRFGEGELNDLDPRGSPNSVREACQDASARIDALLAKAYVLPLPGVDEPGKYPLLVAIAADLTRALLYDEVIPDRVAERAKQAMERVQAIVGGEYELVADDGAVVARRASAQVVGREREFTVGRADRLQGLDGF